MVLHKMWVHLNLIGIGMLTIFLPCYFYTTPNSEIFMSTVLFFSGCYLTTMYFLFLYYKDTKEKIALENQSLKEEINKLNNEKKLLESSLEETANK